jgi:YVTN family beta-propeller protein
MDMIRKNLPAVCLLIIMVFSSGCGRKSAPEPVKAGPQPDGSILVTSNQFLRPAGFQVYLPGRPVDLALMPDGNFLLVKTKADIEMIRLSDRMVMQSLPFRTKQASFTGIVLSRDGRHLYATDASSHVCVAAINSDNIMQWQEPITLPGPLAGGDPAPGDLVLDEKGNKLFVTLSRNNTLAVINMDNNSVEEIPVGIAPYSVICHSAAKAYVSNWGGRPPMEGESSYNTSGSKILVDPETGIASSGTVSVVDLVNGKEIKSIETGLHPCGMVLSPDLSRLYVACANSDIVSVISTSADTVIGSISVHGKEGLKFGSAPNDLTISPDGKYLYVANGTDNAICVIETDLPAEVAGFIPTGWYPASVILNRAGDVMYVANAKGVGSRNQRTDRKGYHSYGDQLGTASIIPLPGNRRELQKMTETVALNNSFTGSYKESSTGRAGRKKVAIPVVPDQSSFFKHVVYIIKENRTYDQVFGDMARGDGDTNLVQFGRDVTPNQHLLAETFVLLDNFYCSGIISADGHQWTDEAYVNDYIEKSVGGFTRSYPYDGDDALAYASSGFIWDNVLKHGLTFRDYGEFVDAVIDPPDATFSDIYRDHTEGTNRISIRAKANLEQLIPYICPTYVGFPLVVPDAYRASQFLKELEEFEENGNLPNLIIMLLPSDHTSGTRPGMPTPRASVADNDLALGQIVEALSESRFWKETCILVTEDDPQNGLDHIDGHRTTGLVISPYTRRGEVVSTYYSQINMVRTIENILGIPPMNQFDLSAEPMSDCFTNKPDFTPFKAVSNNIPLDELNPELVSIAGDQLYWARKSLEQDLDDVDRIDDDIFNRIIWHSVKGYDVPYPVLTK